MFSLIVQPCWHWSILYCYIIHDFIVRYCFEQCGRESWTDFSDYLFPVSMHYSGEGFCMRLLYKHLCKL
jgi:hypothetical protein